MSEPLTDERIEEIKARLDAASPGPYDFIVDCGDGTLRIVAVDGYGNIRGLITKIPSGTNWPNAVNNAEFLSAAFVDISDLLADRERLVARAREWAKKNILLEDLLDNECEKTYRLQARIAELEGQPDRRELEVFDAGFGNAAE